MITSYRIVRPPTAFASSGAKKRPRWKAEAHLRAIRDLPCVVCGKRPVEAAHIRAGNIRLGKRETGIGERASDSWVLPLCAHDHRTGPAAQHSMNELAFWAGHGIDPFVTAMALWGAAGDIEAMETIVREARHA